MTRTTARRGVRNACVAIGLALSASAQAQTFRVGERVQASPTSVLDERSWRDCTVTEVHDFVPKKAYSLRCDPAPGSSSASMFLVNQDWVRAPRGAAATAAAPAPASVQPTHVPAASSSTPAPARVAPGGAQCTVDNDGAIAEPERSIRAAIRAGFERPAAAGADGAVSVHIENVSIGAARAYTPYRDPIEADGRPVYPVRAKFTACTDYRTRLTLVTRERLYACYRDQTNAWACDITAAANTNVRDTTQNVAK